MLRAHSVGSVCADHADRLDDAGVVHQHIGRTEALRGFVHETLTRGVIRHIARHRHRLAAGRVDLPRVRLGLRDGARREHDGRTGLAQRKRRGGADAAAGTRYDCNLSGQTLHRSASAVIGRFMAQTRDWTSEATGEYPQSSASAEGGTDAEQRDLERDDDDHRREQAASDARRQRAAGAGAAPRHRHARSPAVLRYAGAELRRAGAAPSRLGQVGAAAMAAQRARHRRDA